ncbi:hypothetical protein O6H91_01G161600 [Diphasiastrum complanatum]|nr:hypothetical protein O6H91_01G161600 [Diphasiastrum complanatum]
MKLKVQGSPVSPLSPSELTVGSDSAPHRFQNQDSYQTSAGSESSAESRPRFYNKVVHPVTNNNDMFIDSPPSFCSSSVQSLSGDGSDVQLQNYAENGINYQMPENNFVQGFDAYSKRQSVARTLRELEDALLGPDDDDEADLANSLYDASGVTSDLHLTDQLNELFCNTVSFDQPEAQATREARLFTSSEGSEYEMSSFVSGPAKKAVPFIRPMAPPKITPRDLLETMSNPEQLLVLCAEAISDNDLDFAQNVMAKLNQVVSIYGDPMERLAAYMVEGLAARLQSTGKLLYKALKCKDPPHLDLLSAMQVMFEVCPYFKFGYMAANGAIAEAFKDEKRVHIVDLEIAQGSQWISLIQALGARAGGPPHLRITGIGDPEAEFAPAGGLQVVGQRLAKLAESENVPFEFHALPMKLQDMQASSVDRRSNEALAVNSALQLHHMPDESVGTSNHRDRILRVIKSWRPKVLAFVEQEANTNTNPFFPRFMEVLSYYTAVFESLDVTLPRESRERVNVEQKCLARDIVNIIACEGPERVERMEVTGKWRARMAMAGLQPYPLSSFVNNTIKALLESYCTKYTLQEEAGALHLGWLNRRLIVASAWH